MLFAYFFSRTANFDQMLQDGIIAVPLDKIRATHKSPVFGCATEVMPQVEVFELNGLIERSSGQEAVMAQPVHHSLPGEDLFVGGLNDGLGLLVNPFNQWWGVTLHTNVLHVSLRPDRIRTGLGYLGKEKIGESFGRIVGNATTVEAAHVTSRAGWHEHITGAQLIRRRGKIQQLPLGGEHQTMLRFRVDFHL